MLISSKKKKIMQALSFKASRAQGSVLGYATDPCWSLSLIVSPSILQVIIEETQKWE